MLRGVAWCCVLIPRLDNISLVPPIRAISLVPPLTIIPLLPRTIALFPRTLDAIPLVPHNFGVITLVPSLVPEWRWCLYFVGWFVEVLVLSLCWMLVEMLDIFFWFWLRGSSWMLLACYCSERSCLRFFYELLSFLEGCRLFLSVLFHFGCLC